MTRISLLALIASAILAPFGAQAACSAGSDSTTISNVLSHENGAPMARPAKVTLVQYAGGIADYSDTTNTCLRLGVLGSTKEGVHFGNVGADLFVLIKDGKVASVAHIAGFIRTD